jgi:DNA helicase IV
VSDWSSDRLIEGGEAEPGATFDIPDDLPGLAVEAEDEHPLLDAEGNQVRELDLDRPDEIAARSATVRQLAVDEQVWRFGHVIVDEAQDLTPMQWRMVVRRSRGGAVTLLGDLAQRSIGEPGTWDDHLPPEFSLFELQNLTVNYRSPAEINDLARSVLAELVPDLPPSRSVRRSGHPPQIIRVDDLTADLPGIVAKASQAADQTIAGSGRVLPPAVIGFDLPDLDRDALVGPGRWRPLSPWKVKGLEFDSVVVVEPARFLDEPNGLSLLYVALTRSTDRLTIVHHRPIPEVLRPDG